MKNPAHIRAPWQKKDDGGIFAGRHEIGRVFLLNLPTQKERIDTFEANCRLIEKAPELLMGLEASYVAMVLGNHVDRSSAIKYAKNLIDYIRGARDLIAR